MERTIFAPFRFITRNPHWWSSYVPNQEGLDVWAPEIFYYNGTYYLYYSISTFGSRVSAIGLVTTKSISGGKWTDQGVVISSNDASNYNAIDPNITADANGNLWMTFGYGATGFTLPPSTKQP